MTTATHTDEVTYAAYWGNLLLNTETGRYYILANSHAPDLEALRCGDMVGRGCPCGDRTRLGLAVSAQQTEEINDRIAAGELQVEDNPAMPTTSMYVRGVGGVTR